MKHKYIPYIIFGFVLFYILGNFYLIYISKINYSGVVTENAYKKGVNFNETIKEGELQLKSGYKFDVHFNTQDTILSIKLTKFDRIVSNIKLELELIRPLSVNLNKLIELESNSKGIYTTKLDLPLKGLWHIKIKGISKDNVGLYHFEKIIVSDL